MCLYMLVCACSPSAGCVEAGGFLGLGNQTALWYRFQAMERPCLKHQGNQCPVEWYPRLTSDLNASPVQAYSTHWCICTHKHSHKTICKTQNQTNIKIRQRDGSGNNGLAMKMSKLALRPPDSRVWDSCTQEAEDAGAMVTNYRS